MPSVYNVKSDQHDAASQLDSLIRNLREAAPGCDWEAQYEKEEKVSIFTVRLVKKEPMPTYEERIAALEEENRKLREAEDARKAAEQPEPTPIEEAALPNEPAPADKTEPA